MRSPRFAAVTFHFTCQEPVSIGDPLHEDILTRIATPATDNPEPGRAPDVPATMDPFGKPLVRGTSIAGALREHLTAYELVEAHEITESPIHSRTLNAQSRTRTATLADLLCGSMPEEVATAAPGTRPAPRPTPSLTPSALRVVSVQTTAGRVAAPPTRVAINRSRGAAEPTKLYTRGRVEDLELDVALHIDLTILGTRCADLFGSGRAEEPSGAPWRTSPLRSLRGSRCSAVCKPPGTVREWCPGSGQESQTRCRCPRCWGAHRRSN